MGQRERDREVGIDKEERKKGKDNDKRERLPTQNLRQIKVILKQSDDGSPVSLTINLLKLYTFVNYPVRTSGSLPARNADPYLIVEHPQQQRRENQNIRVQ
ncbi:hypothetical protein M5K25_015588 [Dendrobium thyrsiflorum]|uniref:Uncharacterized protein n=1 Tax=Dendrobium thyrsiflorum TaxID=117978 RepID=A0ABD0URJ4_DENTH